MNKKRRILPIVLCLAFLSLVVGGCDSGKQALSFSQLIDGANGYNGQTVNVEAFYYDGFEISALAGSLAPASSGDGRLVPDGHLVWVASGISPELLSRLHSQNPTPSGYPEHFGKLNATGKYETGGKYGHLDAYQYQIAITNAAVIDWSPPRATAATGLAAGTIPAGVFFPVQPDQYIGDPYPDAMAKGIVILEGNYLRLKAAGGAGESALLVWPPGFKLQRNNQGISIVDKNEKPAARLGDQIQISGGLVSGTVIEQYIGSSLPADCQGPFWLVANVIPLGS